LLNCAASMPSRPATARSTSRALPASTSPPRSSRASRVDAPLAVRRTTRTTSCTTPATSKVSRTLASVASWWMAGATSRSPYRATDPKSANVMASMMVLLPEPVGPTRATTSTSTKLTSVGARNAPNPTISSSRGLTGHRPAMWELPPARGRAARRTAPHPRIVDRSLAEVGGEELLRRAPRPEAGPEVPAATGESTRTSTARSPKRARTSSAKPARWRSRTTRRSQASPSGTVARSSSTVPR
jgi:hypothetical protein